jgi:hypothetical protein
MFNAFFAGECTEKWAERCVHDFSSVFLEANAFIVTKSGGIFMLERLLCPPPHYIKTSDGIYEFGEEICCYYNPKADIRNELRFYEELWTNFLFGICHLKCIEAEELGQHQILITNSEREICFPKLQKEYMIVVNQHGMLLEGKDKPNVFRAFSTLLQILRPIHIENGKGRFAAEFVEIHDKPFLGFRGLHICIFPQTKLDFVKKVVRFAGMLKYTHIILEPWGMFKLNSMPELAWENAYTKDEICAIVKDANSMGMEVIPMINHLGHASMSRGKAGKHVVLDQNPQKALLFEPDGWSWCISNPVVTGLLKEIREELAQLCGPGSYFHLGCDEAGTYATCYECRKNDRVELLKNYLNSISNDLAQMGRRAIVWGDMFLERGIWKYPYEANSYPGNPVHMVLNELDKNIIIADWQYNIKTELFSNELDANIQKAQSATSRYFISNGFDVITCPYQEYGNIKALSIAAADIGALGMLTTTWHTLYNHMASVAYASVAGWSGKEHLNNTEYILKLGRCCGNLTRKLVPSDGSYEKSGWASFEVFS